MSQFFAWIFVLTVIIGLPVLAIMAIVKAAKKKPLKGLIKIVMWYIISLVVLFVLVGLTDPATWCKHEYNIVKEVAATCTTPGEIYKICPLCENEKIEYIDKLPHTMEEVSRTGATCTKGEVLTEECSKCGKKQTTEVGEPVGHLEWVADKVIEATCTKEGAVIEKCKVCGETRTKELINPLGHSMVQMSRTDATTELEGEIIRKCEQCGYEEKTKLSKIEGDKSNSEVSNANDNVVKNAKKEAYVVGDKVEGSVEDIVDDGIIEKLCTFGFTEDESNEIRIIFLKCGLTNIDNAEKTDANATIDDLVAFRVVMDEDKTAWFTVENRELFYVGMNGEDVYDLDKGGFLINIDDIHIPESDISLNVFQELRELAEKTLDGYFVSANYYDAWGIARQDNEYMCQCEVYASNKLGVKDWVKAKVWFEYANEKYNVVAVMIDGVRYK